MTTTTVNNARDSGSGLADALIVGAGHLGLPLAAALIKAGLIVDVLDTDKRLIDDLGRGRYGREPGVAEALRAGRRRLRLHDKPPAELPRVVVLCVGTPYDRTSNRPDLSQVSAAVDALTPGLTGKSLLIVKSTMPVGGTREIAERIKRRCGTTPLIAYCPDRVIEGVALDELPRLPQVIGGSPESVSAACRFFDGVTQSVVPVSSTEAAELVKLLNNGHTDLLYAFANQAAIAAESFGLDASEVIRACNDGYPRPDLALPGWVGGSCLTKDPLALAWSARQAGAELPLVTAARDLNERVADRAADFITNGTDPYATVLFAGIAYKGQPETDDTRGGAAEAIRGLMEGGDRQFLGHDYAASPDRIAALGIQPVSLPKGVAQAQGVIFCNDHPRYREHLMAGGLAELLAGKVIYDIWGVVPPGVAARLGRNYKRFGHG